MVRRQLPPTSTFLNFIAKINAWRMREGVTVQTMARACDMSRCQMHHILSGGTQDVFMSTYDRIRRGKHKIKLRLSHDKRKRIRNV